MDVNSAQPVTQGQPKSLLATVTTVLSAISVARSVLPVEWLIRRCNKFGRIRRITQPDCVYNFSAYNNSSSPDGNFEKIKVYLSKHSNFDAQRLTVTQPRRSAEAMFALADGETVTDKYHNIEMRWTYTASQHADPGQDCRFCLCLRRKHKHSVAQYLQHIKLVADELIAQNRQLQVYNNGSRSGYYEEMWEGQPFKHPATFATIALDPQLKQAVVASLDRFSNDAHYYHRTGRAHKMGILLYGPPGTGKTTFVAALANYMHYDVYDMDLASVYGDRELRQLFSQIPDRTIIVIEDIDAFALPNRSAQAAQRAGGVAQTLARSPSQSGSDWAAEPDSSNLHHDPSPVEQHNQPSSQQDKVTLAGLLNFADGLRSSCASQHIFVFTTNYPEKLDPALVRPGRMDLHIKLGYCSFEEFQTLCYTYLDISTHARYAEIKEVFDRQPRVTPAQITSILHVQRDNSDRALVQVVDLLRSKCSGTPSASQDM